ncbi:ATP-binding protein [Streptomyces sp. NPDC047974]|uniref:ATP-binding protein n=1 Tax=Streptomyces sp. NPDC047974 TaxID=3154343 RepID=UPI0033C98A02
MTPTAEVQTLRPSSTVCARDLLPEEQEPGRLRHWVREHLVRLELSGLSDDLTLIAGELAANALRHGGAPAHVTMTVTRTADGGGVVRLEFTDSGPGFDLERVQRAGACSFEESVERCDGRGLLIVAALSTRWGYRRIRSGHVVWAELCLPAQPCGRP